MIRDVVAAIRAAESSGRALHVPGLQGLSGDRLIGMLQRLAQLGDMARCYAEIGVYRGLTLISVAKAAPNAAVFGIDNFSQFDPNGENRGFVEARIDENNLTNVTLLNDDFEAAVPRLNDCLQGRRVGTFFVDGPHDYRSQLMCLELMKPWLAEFAVIVVDDSNYLHVRQANKDFLVVHPEFKLLFEAYTPCHPDNMTSSELNDAKRGWWNGVNVLVHDPNDELQRSYPETDSARAFFLNDHLVHGSGIAEYADVAIDVVASMVTMRPLRSIAGVASIVRRKLSRKRDQGLRANYLVANTFSAGLTSGRMAAAQKNSNSTV